MTSPSIDTTSKPSPLAHYLQPLQPTTHPGAHPQLQLQVPPTHPGAFPSASHLQPLGNPNHYLGNTASWSSEQVTAWLQHVGCGEAAASFKAMGIDGHAFSGLLRVVSDAGAARLDDRLSGDFGLGNVALRLKLVDKMMAELAAGGYRSQH